MENNVIISTKSLKKNFEKLEVLIVNGTECEPYITVDYRECIENSWDIMSGVYSLADILGIIAG